MASITYTDKDKTGSGTVTQWRDVDANEIKTVVNGKDDKDAQDSATGVSGTYNIDFDGATNMISITISGNVTFTTSNKGACKSKVILIIGDSSTRTFSFPSWKWAVAVPASLAASKFAILSLLCFGTAESDVVATYIAQP